MPDYKELGHDQINVWASAKKLCGNHLSSAIVAHLLIAGCRLREGLLCVTQYWRECLLAALLVSFRHLLTVYLSNSDKKKSQMCAHFGVPFSAWLSSVC